MSFFSDMHARDAGSSPAHSASLYWLDRMKYQRWFIISPVCLSCHFTLLYFSTATKRRLMSIVDDNEVESVMHRKREREIENEIGRIDHIQSKWSSFIWFNFRSKWGRFCFWFNMSLFSLFSLCFCLVSTDISIGMKPTIVVNVMRTQPPDDQHDCSLEMTYMYENPTYPQIPMPDAVKKSYPRYSLHSYCEGTRCEAHRRNQFEGRSSSESVGLLNFLPNFI